MLMVIGMNMVSDMAARWRLTPAYAGGSHAASALPGWMGLSPCSIRSVRLERLSLRHTVGGTGAARQPDREGLCAGTEQWTHRRSPVADALSPRCERSRPDARGGNRAQSSAI